MEIRIGTRGSALALWQAHFVQASILRVAPDAAVHIAKMDLAAGDGRVSGWIGQEAYTRAFGKALRGKEIDLAVQSLKHLPPEIGRGLVLGAVPNRANPADGLITRDDCMLEELPSEAIVLTSVPRRRAQVLAMRPDIKVRPIRGDVASRIEEFRESSADGIIMSCAGLGRMGLAHLAHHHLDPRKFVPAAGQGALGVVCRENDADTRKICSEINDPECEMVAAAERAFMGALDIDLHVPVGAYGYRDQPGKNLCLVAMVAEADGQQIIREQICGNVSSVDEAVEVGADMASFMMERGADEILSSMRSLDAFVD